MQERFNCAIEPRRVVLLVWIVACCGCGDGGAQQNLMEEAQASVEAALDVWRSGEKPASLLTGSRPVEFFDDDWNRSVKLVDFSVHTTYLETDGTPRCAVDLVLKKGDQPPETVRVIYEMVNKDNRLVIGRDPMS